MSQPAPDIKAIFGEALEIEAPEEPTRGLRPLRTPRERGRGPWYATRRGVVWTVAWVGGRIRPGAQCPTVEPGPRGSDLVIGDAPRVASRGCSRRRDYKRNRFPSWPTPFPLISDRCDRSTKPVDSRPHSLGEGGCRAPTAIPSQRVHEEASIST